MKHSMEEVNKRLEGIPITIKNLTDEYNQLLGYKAALEEMKDSKSKNKNGDK
jgi:tetrahydromethanopterin S-methyltransferase subunit G